MVGQTAIDPAFDGRFSAVVGNQMIICFPVHDVSPTPYIERPGSEEVPYY
jgi:hypothetical protein